MARRTKEEAQQTRLDIIDAAEQAFFERGMTRTTMADIAARAGVTRGAVYWHFSDKAAVVRALLDGLREPVQALAEACESEHERDPLGRLRQLLIALFNRITRHARARRVIEILMHKCELTDEMTDVRQQRCQKIVDCHVRVSKALQNAVNRGQLPADLDVPRAAVLLHAQIDGILNHWLLVPDAFDLPDGTERLVDNLLDNLRHSVHLRICAPAPG